jgi:MFS family permease
MLRSLLVDISPLQQHREYRLLFSGQVISLLGRHLTIVASSIQVFELTGETFAVGLLGVAQFPPLLIGAVLGGTMADAFDRRRILIISQILMALTTVGLAINAMSDSPAVWIVFALVMVNALVSAIDSPARSASIPNLVRAALLPAAFAIQVLTWQIAGAAGPALGGVIIARSGVAAAYWGDAITFAAALITLAFMAPLPPAGGGTRPGFRSIAEGARFIRGSRALQGIFLLDSTAMVVGMPRALFPEWGVELLGGDEATVGLLFAAPAVGAMIGGFFSGRLSKIRSSGKATVVAVVIWGLAIAAFGFSTSLVLALVTLAIAGGADALSAVFRQTILQVTAPDRLRGRVSAVQIAVVAGGPRVGDAEAGTVAALTTPRIAAWSGGLLAAAGALVIARLLPTFRKWHLDDHALELDVGEVQPDESAETQSEDGSGN